MTSQSSATRGRGCLFYGIVIGSILLVFVVVGLIVSYRFVKNTVLSMVETYTQTNAVSIPTVELSPEKLQDIRSRIANFQEAYNQAERTNVQELALSADEINGLIAGDPEAKDLKNHVFIRMEDDRISGDVSIPLEDVGPLKLKGRYLNGHATFKISLTNQNLWVSMEQMEVSGKPLPGMLQSELVKQNWAQQMREDPDVQSFLEKMDTIRVEDGKLILRTRGPPAPSGN